MLTCTYLHSRVLQNQNKCFPHSTAPPHKYTCTCTRTHAHTPGSRRILDNSLDLALVECEPNLVGTSLLHGDGAFEGAVPDSQCDAVALGLFDDLGSFVAAVACHNLTVNLQGQDQPRKYQESQHFINNHIHILPHITGTWARVTCDNFPISTNIHTHSHTTCKQTETRK